MRQSRLPVSPTTMVHASMYLGPADSLHRSQSNNESSLPLQRFRQRVSSREIARQRWLQAPKSTTSLSLRRESMSTRISLGRQSTLGFVILPPQVFLFLLLAHWDYSESLNGPTESLPTHSSSYSDQTHHVRTPGTPPEQNFEFPAASSLRPLRLAWLRFFFFLIPSVPFKLPDKINYIKHVKNHYKKSREHATALAGRRRGQWVVIK